MKRKYFFKGGTSNPKLSTNWIFTQSASGWKQKLPWNFLLGLKLFALLRLLKSNKFHWTYRTPELKTREKCWWRKKGRITRRKISISFFKQAQWHSDGRVCDKLCFYEEARKGKNIFNLPNVGTLSLLGSESGQCNHTISRNVHKRELWEAFIFFVQFIFGKNTRLSNFVSLFPAAGDVIYVDTNKRCVLVCLMCWYDNKF